MGLAGRWRVGVAVVYVIVRRALQMALRWGRDVLARWRWIVGRVVSRVRGVGVVAMIDRGRRRRREVVALWEVARVVGVGGVHRRAMAGAVATGAISRVVFACDCE
jgi:hypothetical protein